MEAVGSRVGGRFRIAAVLGRGGMATVYRAIDESNGRELALKHLVHPDDASEKSRERNRLRFRREYHTHVALRHPRIVSVYDYGLERGEPYYTMELLSGRDLRHIGRVPHRTACALLRDIAAALAMLHAKQLVHRDVTLGNVRCTEGDRAKVIDLGVVASVGAAGEIAGTPPFIAPETARALPVDHRADLFGLGVVAYWLLTGRHAFKATTLAELHAAWRDAPPPPSMLVSGIPAALDTLVLSMLSIDPLARPMSAAEVIDRLSAIGELAPSSDLEVARGYLASAALVGRHKEMGTFRRRWRSADEGQGGALVIEAPSGTGKSRLLREMALEARLQGSLVAETAGDASRRGPYGVVAEVCARIDEIVPDALRTALRERSDALAGVLPDLASKAGIAPQARSRQRRIDPREERMRAQDALVGLFLELAKERPLAIFVDDVQRCDEASAAVLATLGHAAHDARVLLGIALRTDEPADASAPLDRLRAGSRRLRLRGLDGDDTETLLRTLFGPVPNVTRLASHVHRIAGGNPLCATELMRQLVERRVIKYLDGVWSLPEELSPDDVPRGLADTLTAGVDRLSKGALALGEVLAVHGGDIPLEMVLRIAEDDEEERLFAAIDELQSEGIVVSSGDGCRFRHDGIREALLRRLGDARRAALHLRVGDALSEQGAVPPELEATVGWHLLRGGERRRGAELLLAAGRRLFDAGSHQDCVAPIEAALEVHDQEDRDADSRLRMRWMLLIAGCIASRDVALRYASSVPREFAHISGLADAGRIGRVLGMRLGLLCGIAIAWARWFFTPPRRRSWRPFEAMLGFYSSVTYAASAYAACFEPARIDELMELARPMLVIERRTPAACFALMRALRESVTTGHATRMAADCETAIQIARLDVKTPMMDHERKMLEGGARFIRAIALVVVQDPNEELEAMARLELRFFDVACLQLRTCLHRWRGERDASEACEQEVERLFVQLGSVWLMESFLPMVSMFAYGHTDDFVGMRSMVDKLERLTRGGYNLGNALDIGRAEYYRMRGETERARRIIDTLLARLRPDEHMMRTHAMPVLADLVADGAESLPDAERIAREALAHTSDPDVGRPCPKWRCAMALARIETAQGKIDSAAALLDGAITDAETWGLPASCGMLHELRARIASTARERAVFERHATAAKRWMAMTRNPVLIARVERLEFTAYADAPTARALGPAPSPDVDTFIKQAASTEEESSADKTVTDSVVSDDEDLLDDDQGS